MDRTARCACGQLSVSVSGDPEFHGVCSCLACQRMTGSAFDYSGYWLKSAVKDISGDHRFWRRQADTGRWFEQHFCTNCGSTVFSYGEWAPDMINIAIGCFADHGFPPPTYAVWNRHKHPWLTLPEDLESMDEQPDDAPEQP